MRARQWIWGIWLLVVLCYVVPYALLGGVEAWYGSFLFWCVVGVLVIGANIMITRDLRDDGAPGHAVGDVDAEKERARS